MENKMATAVQGSGFNCILGLYRDNGKENGNYYIGFVRL